MVAREPHVEVDFYQILYELRSKEGCIKKLLVSGKRQSDREAVWTAFKFYRGKRFQNILHVTQLKTIGSCNLS
jgi:hypothetical protein